MPRGRRWTEEERALVIEYFYSHTDNRDRVIAEALGFTQSMVCNTLLKHLNEKADKVREERARDTSD